MGGKQDTKWHTEYDPTMHKNDRVTAAMKLKDADSLEGKL